MRNMVPLLSPSIVAVSNLQVSYAALSFIRYTLWAPVHVNSRSVIDGTERAWSSALPEKPFVKSNCCFVPVICAAAKPTRREPHAARSTHRPAMPVCRLRSVSVKIYIELRNEESTAMMMNCATKRELWRVCFMAENDMAGCVFYLLRTKAVW